MEFEQIGLWYSDLTDSVPDLRPPPLSDHLPPSPIFSPTQSEYGCMLEAMEMELLSRPQQAGGAGALRGSSNEEEEIEEEGVEDGGRAEEGSMGCKNLVSERNRRRRLNQQLLALRSLVPCISKMDKRSILMDAAAYVQSLHSEIEQIKQELSMQEASQGSTTTSTSESNSPTSDVTLPSQDSSPPHHHISQIEIDAVDDRIYVIKVTFQKSRGAAGQVQRMIESLGLSISQSWIHELDADAMISTSFINVKRQTNLTADVLKVQLRKAAFKFGLEIDTDD